MIYFYELTDILNEVLKTSGYYQGEALISIFDEECPILFTGGKPENIAKAYIYKENVWLMSSPDYKGNVSFYLASSGELLDEVVCLEMPQGLALILEKALRESAK